MDDMRMKRIERLVAELECEITWGVMDREISPYLDFERLIPGGPTGEFALQLFVRPLRKEERIAAMRRYAERFGGDDDLRKTMAELPTPKESE